MVAPIKFPYLLEEMAAMRIEDQLHWREEGIEASQIYYYARRLGIKVDIDKDPKDLSVYIISRFR